MKDFVRTLYRLTDKVTHWLSWTAPLLTRIMVGYTFYYTGYGKTHSPEVQKNLVQMMADNHIPFPEANAWFVGHLEWIGAMFLVVGLLTRPVALMLWFSMGVAMMTADRSDFLGSWSPDSKQGPSDIASFVLFCYLIWLVWYGAGAFSLDKLAGMWLRRWSGAKADEVDQA